MTFLSVRRAVPALVSVAAIAALALPSVAAAETKPDINEQCSGPNIQGEGSTFQGPAEFALTGFNWETSKEQTTGYNHSTNESRLWRHAGQQTGADGPATTRRTRLNAEAAAALKSFGAGVTTFGEEKEEKGVKDKYPRMSRFPYCGTDEAPSAAAKVEMEKFAESAVADRVDPVCPGRRSDRDPPARRLHRFERTADQRQTHQTGPPVARPVDGRGNLPRD